MTNFPTPIGPYSPGVSAGGFVFISGQIGGALPNIRDATADVINSLGTILAAHNLGLRDVVKTTVFMTNLNDFAVMNEIYAAFFSAPYPARSTIGVFSLPKNAVIEIECIARVPAKNRALPC
jgi:2-iminobutanoate/2-iminopropanoate deaminase